MRSRSSIEVCVLTLVLCGVLAACGGTTGSTTGNGGGGGNPPPNVQGMWSISTVSNAGNPPNVIYINLTQTQDTFFAASGSIVNCSANTTPPFIPDLTESCNGGSGAILTATGGGGNSDAVNGTVASDGTIQATVSLAECNTGGAGCTITATGNVSGSQMTGTYTSSIGDTGSFTGTMQGSVAGTYTGSLSGPSLAEAMTINVTQNADYSLSGTVTLTNCSVIQSFTIQQANTIGGAFAVTIPGSSNTWIGVTPAGNNSWFVDFQITGTSSACFGTGTLTKQ
ncbi:MAG: hypothetical protein WAN14_16545 [Candidatus Acidiferrales bacterium]